MIQPNDDVIGEQAVSSDALKEAVQEFIASTESVEASTGKDESIVFSTEQNSAAVAIAADEFAKEFRQRSFSGRNPELGKMINCGICSRRHRSTQVCEQKFATTIYHGKVQCEPREAPVQRPHLTANRFGWRPDPRIHVRLVIAEFFMRKQAFLERIHRRVLRAQAVEQRIAAEQAAVQGGFLPVPSESQSEE